MFKWSGWNKYTRNKLNQIAADASAGGGGDSGGGGGGGILIVKEIHSGSRGTLDKTFQEIYDAFMSGANIYVWNNAPESADATPLTVNCLLDPVSLQINPGDQYAVRVGDSSQWTANALDEHPSYSYD